MIAGPTTSQNLGEKKEKKKWAKLTTL